MIKKLEQILDEIKEYRKTMHDGTTSVLVDNWIRTTEQMIEELKFLGE